MKKSNLILLSALGAILLFSSAFQLTVNRYARRIEQKPKTAKWNTVSRNVAKFDQVSTNAAITLVYQKGITPKLEIQTNVPFVDSITTKVVKGELKIDLLKSLKHNDSVAIVITNPELSGIRLGGESHFIGKDTLSGNHITMVLTNKSSAKIILDYNTVEYTNTSSGSVDIKGILNQIKITDPMKK